MNDIEKEIANNVAKPYVFISYQTSQKSLAGEAKDLLSNVGINAFLAHEDIHVSQEWRDKILEELGKADIFVCLLSTEYFDSAWCVQESGIAAYRDIPIISISIDDSIPQGFISAYQAGKLKNVRPEYADILPGLVKYNLDLGIQIGMYAVAHSPSFRVAEHNLEALLPYVNELDDRRAKELMRSIRENAQVHHATLCAREYIPPLLEKFGHLLEEDDFAFLSNVCKQYSV